MRSLVADLLASVAAALDAREVRWYVFGAQAAILHGAARLTADVDISVFLPQTMTPVALAEALERHAFQRRITDPAFFARTRVIPFLHLPTALPLDVVLAGPGLEEEFFDRSLVRDVDGVRVPIASAEDLVVMKVLAGRPKDLEDVVAILAAQGTAFNASRVRTTLVLLEQALGQSDLLVTFEGAITRSR